jgi:NAD-dependent SIR2 family protein deacetylase
LANSLTQPFWIKPSPQFAPVIASLAIVAKEQGARVVEINLEPTPYSHKLDLALQGKAGVLLPQVVEGL